VTISKGFFVLRGIGLFCPAPVKNSILYADKEFKFHLWYGGVT
jgi:hypothetical protein